MDYLTAQDLRLANYCPTKLYYKKHGYAITAEMDSYGRALSDGSLILEYMARLLYPDGLICAGIEDTQTKIPSANVLYGATFWANHKLARVDVLVIQGDRVQIIHHKNRTFDSKANWELEHYRGLNIFRSKRTGEVNSDWRGTIEDVSWQKWVLNELYPHWQIDTYLLLPDCHKSTKIPNLLRQFRVYADQKGNNQVEFRGDRQLLIANLHENVCLSSVQINPEVMEVLPQLQAQAQQLMPHVLAGFPRPVSSLGKHCRDCEFKEGYRECWGELATVQPHIFDLYQMGRLTFEGAPLVNQLISSGKVSLYDVPLQELHDPTYSDRQLIQIEYTQKNREWLSPQLGKILAGYAYPLYFIDFETARAIVPWDQGLRPNEQVAFQWSCHTISTPQAEPQHRDWLDTTSPFPNLGFAESLCAQIAPNGEPKGTVLTWGSHEVSVLKDIHRQMSMYGYRHLPSARKLEQFLAKAKFVDMDGLTRSHYFHPLMKQKTSLKWVLSAIWKTNPYLHKHPYFQNFLKIEAGEVISPYASLPPLAIDGQKVAIADGSGAMLAYLEIICGKNCDRPEIRALWEALLKQYCHLDTLAMVIVWHHWQKLQQVSTIKGLA